MRNHSNDKVSMADSADATIGRAVSVSEAFRPNGMYDVSCIGPRDELRADYLTLLDRQAAFYARRSPVGLTPALVARVSDAVQLERAAVMSALVTPRSIEDLLRRMEEPKWREQIHNLVPDEGANFMLDTVWAGAGYTATVYMGLISSVGWVVVANTNTAAQINGANQWREAGPANAPNYSQASRPAMSFSAAAGRSKSLSTPCVFSMSAVGTLKGVFASTSSTKQGTTGKLISAGQFTSGDRTVGIGDTVNATYTSTAA